jgi:branched-subunit amino acid aminotransferase/4-amino-4-deoxychorismate lyase
MTVPPATAVAWVDGEVLPASEARVSVFDRTLLYGLGAFETFRLWGGVPFLLERHVQRMRRSLAALDLPDPPGLERLGEGVAALAAAAGTPDAICRVTVTAGSAGGSVVAPMRLLAMLRAVPEPPGPEPVVVGVAATRHDKGSPVAGVKSTSYLTHYLLREHAEAQGRVDDLMLDDQDHVGEATVSTVFVVRGGALLTPPLSTGVLEGVTRGEILRLAGERGVPAREEELALDEVTSADECFLTGAGKCLVSVDEVAGTTLPRERPVTTTLRDALARSIVACCGVDRAAVRF